jgi:ankyrin repeat protein
MLKVMCRDDEDGLREWVADPATHTEDTEDTADGKGHTALGLAARHGAVKCMTILIKEADANVNALTATAGGGGGGASACYLASQSGHVACLELLLGARPAANIHASLTNGATPLIAAARHGHLECVVRLLEAGANARAITRTGTSALLMAARYGFVEVARSLVDAGGAQAVAAKDSTGSTALHEAAGGVYVDVVVLLLSKVTEAAKADLKQAEEARRGHVEVETGGVGASVGVVRGAGQGRGGAGARGLLASKGQVDVDAMNKQGVSALMLALQANHNGYNRVGKGVGEGEETKGATAPTEGKDRKDAVIRIATMLLEAGASVHQQAPVLTAGPVHGQQLGNGAFKMKTPLYFAARDGLAEVMALLLAGGCKINTHSNERLREGKRRRLAERTRRGQGVEQEAAGGREEGMVRRVDRPVLSAATDEYDEEGQQEEEGQVEEEEEEEEAAPVVMVEEEELVVDKRMEVIVGSYVVMHGLMTDASRRFNGVVGIIEAVHDQLGYSVRLDDTGQAPVGGSLRAPVESVNTITKKFKFANVRGVRRVARPIKTAPRKRSTRSTKATAAAQEYAAGGEEDAIAQAAVRGDPGTQNARRERDQEEAEREAESTDSTDGCAALAIALQHCHLSVAALLLKAGANINGRITSDDMQAPIHVCAMVGSLEGLQLLVNSGADLDAVMGDGTDALWRACRYGRADCARWISEQRQPQPGAAVEEGAEEGGAEMARQVIVHACAPALEEGGEEADEDEEEQQEEEPAPAPAAVSPVRQRVKQIETAVLQKGSSSKIASPAAVAGASGSESAGAGRGKANKRSNPSEVEEEQQEEGGGQKEEEQQQQNVLVAKLAPQAQLQRRWRRKLDGSRFGCTGRRCTTPSPLHVACAHGHTEVVRVLLRAAPLAVDRCLRDSNGLAPLHVAARFTPPHARVAVMEALLGIESAPADTTIIGNTSGTATATNGGGAVANIDVNALEPVQGRSALWMAAEAGHTDIVETLLRASLFVTGPSAVLVGAGVLSKDSRVCSDAVSRPPRGPAKKISPAGHTALDIALANGHTAAARLLRTAGGAAPALEPNTLVNKCVVVDLPCAADTAGDSGDRGVEGREGRVLCYYGQHGEVDPAGKHSIAFIRGGNGGEYEDEEEVLDVLLLRGVNGGHTYRILGK